MIEITKIYLIHTNNNIDFVVFYSNNHMKRKPLILYELLIVNIK